MPNICPDLIYLDGPDQFSARGSVRGITTTHQDRMPMSGDILSFEHFLQPGTLIVVDGRTANARFLVSNLQRQWAYFHSEEFDPKDVVFDNPQKRWKTSFINPPIKYPTYLLQIASDCNIIFRCQKKKILGNYQ